MLRLEMRFVGRGAEGVIRRDGGRLTGPATFDYRCDFTVVQLEACCECQGAPLERRRLAAWAKFPENKENSREFLEILADFGLMEPFLYYFLLQSHHLVSNSLFFRKQGIRARDQGKCFPEQGIHL
jgi:hypothetical protein